MLCVEVGILVWTSLHYGFVGCLPLSYLSVSPIQTIWPQECHPSVRAFIDSHLLDTLLETHILFTTFLSHLFYFLN